MSCDVPVLVVDERVKSAEPPTIETAAWLARLVASVSARIVRVLCFMVL